MEPSEGVERWGENSEMRLERWYGQVKKVLAMAGSLDFNTVTSDLCLEQTTLAAG